MKRPPSNSVVVFSVNNVVPARRMVYREDRYFGSRHRRAERLYFKYFYYPQKGGYGAICERLYQEVRPFVRMQLRLIAVEPLGDNRGYRCTFDQCGQTVTEEFDVLISSLPLSLFAGLMGLDLKLRFRSARLTYLLINKKRMTDNHWFYFADGDFLINRVAEFKNFADNGLPVDKTVVCCEVTQVDRYSLDKVIAELASAGVLQEKDILDRKIIDIKHAYPIYDVAYEEEMKRADHFFSAHPNVHHVGRHAQFAHKDVDEIFDEAKKVSGRVLDRKIRRDEGCRQLGNPHHARASWGQEVTPELGSPL